MALLTALVVGLLTLFHQRQALGQFWRGVSTGLALVAVAVSLLRGILRMRLNLRTLAEWDFIAFWLTGRVAVQGLDLYDPASYRPLADALHLSREFVHEVVEVGSLYPPPTALLFAPLGLLDLQTAYIVWYVVNCSALAAAILIMWRTFVPSEGAHGLLLVIVLTLLSPATQTNIGFAQTSFLLLLFVALFWRDQAKPSGGVWLAAGAVVKPFVACLMLYLLLRRRWAALAYFVATLFCVSLVSLSVFDLATWSSYFAVHPASRLPPGYFGELGNGSLYAFWWRTTKGPFDNHLAVTAACFAATATVLVAAWSWLSWRLEPERSGWALAGILSVALLLYPNTGTHYALALMPAILWLWSERQGVPGRHWSVICFVSVLYGLLGFRGGWSSLVFVAFAFAAAFFLGSAYRLVRADSSVRARVPSRPTA